MCRTQERVKGNQRRLSASAQWGWLTCLAPPFSASLTPGQTLRVKFQSHCSNLAKVRAKSCQSNQRNIHSIFERFQLKKLCSLATYEWNILNSLKN